MASLRFGALISVAIFVVACAARAPEMVVDTVCPTCPKDTRLAGTIEVASTAVATQDLMGVDILENEDFRSALEQSLENNGLLRTKGTIAPYVLDVDLIEFDHPTAAGLTVPARPTMRYVLRERATNTKIVDELVTSSAVVTRDDTCCFDAQLRLAIERSTKSNIAIFIRRLMARFESSRLDNGRLENDGA